MRNEEMMSAARSTWAAESDSVANLAMQIDPEAFCKTVRIIGKCAGRIVTTGCGTSAAAAKKISHSLNCIGRPSFLLYPGDAPHGGLGALQPGDVMIMISKGGNTGELTALIPSIKARQTFLIGVTEAPDSAIGRQSDLVLKVKVEREPDEFNMLATASTLAVIALFDAVCIAVMKYTGFNREQFAVIHPHGAVGDRLLKGEGKKS